MATRITNLTSMVPIEVPLLGISEEVVILLQCQLVYKNPEEASGERTIRIYNQQGDIDNGNTSAWFFSLETGWLNIANDDDISPTAVKAAVAEAPTTGQWFTMTNTEYTDMMTYLVTP